MWCCSGSAFSAASTQDVATATLKQQLQCIQCVKLRICEGVHRNTICCLNRKRTQCCSSLWKTPESFPVRRQLWPHIWVNTHSRSVLRVCCLWPVMWRFHTSLFVEMLFPGHERRVCRACKCIIQKEHKVNELSGNSPTDLWQQEAVVKEGTREVDLCSIIHHHDKGLCRKKMASGTSCDHVTCIYASERHYLRNMASADTHVYIREALPSKDGIRWHACDVYIREVLHSKDGVRWHACEVYIREALPSKDGVRWHAYDVYIREVLASKDGVGWHACDVYIREALPCNDGIRWHAYLYQRGGTL